MLSIFPSLIVITIALFALNSEAFAKHRHHHRNHHRHHYHWQLGFWYGAPLWVPGYYYHHRPIYYSSYPDYRFTEDPEPECNALVESCLRIPATSEPISTTPRVEYSYYCPESKAYYPAVKSCSTSWLRVLPGTVTEIAQ